MQRALTIALGCAALLVCPGAHAQQLRAPPEPVPIVIEAQPLLGPSTPTSRGWFTCTLRLSNPTAAQIVGTVELVSRASWSGDEQQAVTIAPFAVAGRSAVSVQLPTHGFGRASPVLQVRARDGQEQTLASAEIADPQPPAPFLFDLNVPSRVAPGLRNSPLPVTLRRAIRGNFGAPLVAVSSPQVSAVTGEPVLPVRAAGYSSATLVLARSEQLARLRGAELGALTDWVLAGGALAVVVTRPEDLQGSPLHALLGGTAQTQEVGPELRGEAVFEVIEDPATGGSPPLSAPGSGGQTVELKRLAPTPAVAERLVGFQGANLRSSPWGASVSYGLGEVHLLAFDVAEEATATDEWTKLKLLSLLRHSWDRKAHVALPHAESALDESALQLVRRQLDPNRAARWAIAAAALLLLGYAILAGPVNFYLAARRGRPLRALLHLPIWAALALTLIVLLGVAAKGLSGRARRLTLVEAGAGMPRAAALRFRGFYASSADQLTVHASDRNALLDVAGQSDDTERSLVVDRDGVRLSRFRAKPWQTVLVREDGFVALAGSVSIAENAQGQLVIKNRAARDLVAVVVKAPGQPHPRYFRRIADGQLVQFNRGEPITSGSAVFSGSTAGLGVEFFAAQADRDAPEISAAWEAIEALADRETHWWPPDVPVLLAQLQGGEGQLSDSGLQVDVDRVLLRVVGYGGVL